MLDRAESGETGLTIHVYEHTLDYKECGSPCIRVHMTELNQVGSHTCAAHSINNAPQLHIYTSKLLHNYIK